jgi:hypothetical protein
VNRDDARRERLAFGALILIQALLYVYLIATRRLPKGHDTLSVYLLQYLFQAHAAQGPGPLLWMANLAHGIVSTWFADLQAGPVQNALLLVGGVPAGTPMGIVFYAGLFVEDLVLTIGVWRLGGRFYRSLGARFFVAVAAVGSSLWVTNIFWNHRLVYAVPLVITLLLEFLETGRRGRLFLALCLSSLQLLGNAIYIPVLSSLTVALFVGVHAWVFRKRLRASLPLLKPRPADAIWLPAMGVVVATVCVAAVDGLGSMRSSHLGRRPDGSVTLDAFLTYPGDVNPLRYLDLAFGLNPSIDFSLYAGLCTVAFAILALARRPGRPVLQLAAVLLLLLFFSMGYLSAVGTVAYDAAPPLHYFRHVALAAPLVRLFFILLAGFGVDAFARSEGAERSSRWAVVGVAVAAPIAVRALWAYWSRQSDTDPIVALLDFTRSGLAPRDTSSAANESTQVSAIVVALLAAAVFVRRSRGGSVGRLLPLLLLLQVVDVFGWRLRFLREGTVALNEEAWALHRVEPLPYFPRRTADDSENARTRIAGKEFFSFGMPYDYFDAFLHQDPAWSRHYVTQWSPSVDLLLRAHARRPLTGDDHTPFSTLRQRSPAEAPAYEKALGKDEPKLQVFAAACVAGSDEEVAALLNRRDFSGDVLLISPSPTAPPGPAPELARNDRLSVTPRVLDYRGDRIRVEVEVPPSRTDAWLFYSDAWHPGWRATVDGAAVPVERADLAYKAVRLHGGRNEVEFRFHAPLRLACTRGVQALSLFWCIATVAWTLNLLGVRFRRAADFGSR